jgi:hypothetical protein
MSIRTSTNKNLLEEITVLRRFIAERDTTDSACPLLVSQLNELQVFSQALSLRASALKLILEGGKAS